MALVLILLLVDRGAVLAWSFGVAAAAGRVPLAGAASSWGPPWSRLWGGACSWSRRGWRAPARTSGPQVTSRAGAGRRAGGSRPPAGARPNGGSPRGRGRRLSPGADRRRGRRGGRSPGRCFATRRGARPSPPRLGAIALPLAAWGAIALAVALGVSGVLRDGTYATPVAASAAATALLGLSALETTGAPGPRRLAFLLALLALAVR